MQELKNIDVAILCGGLGKRLRSEIGESQKVMAKIGEEPFLDVLLQDLARANFKRLILLTGYKAETIEEHYRTNNLGLTIEFSRETEPLGTGGALKNARALIQSDPFICLNGDSFCSLNYEEFLNFYSAKRADAAMVLSQRENSRDFGTITLDGAQRITSFEEKLKSRRPSGPVYVSSGVYCFSKKVFDWMPALAKFMLETDFFSNMVQKEVYGFIAQQTFVDIGTPERLKKARTIFPSF